MRQLPGLHHNVQQHIVHQVQRIGQNTDEDDGSPVEDPKGYPLATTDDTGDTPSRVGMAGASGLRADSTAAQAVRRGATGVAESRASVAQHLKTGCTGTAAALCIRF